MFESETFGPCLVRNLKWEEGAAMAPSDPPPSPSVAMPLSFNFDINEGWR